MRRKLINLIHDSALQNVKFNSSVFEKLRKGFMPFVDSQSGMRNMPTLCGSEISDVPHEDNNTVNTNESSVSISDEADSTVKVSNGTI